MTADSNAAASKAPGAASGPGQLATAAAGEGGAAAEGGRPAGLPEYAAGREDRGGAKAGTAQQREVGAQEGSGEGDDVIKAAFKFCTTSRDAAHGAIRFWVLN